MKPETQNKLRKIEHNRRVFFKKKLLQLKKGVHFMICTLPYILFKNCMNKTTSCQTRQKTWPEELRMRFEAVIEGSRQNEFKQF